MRRSTTADDGRPLRVPAACRISNDDDSSSSLQRQREKLQEWLHDNPHCTLVHVTEDRSVSGAVDLKDRPELGPWLADGKRDEWDTVWVSTQDRLGRDDLHFMAFVKDLLDWRKDICVSRRSVVRREYGDRPAHRLCQGHAGGGGADPYPEARPGLTRLPASQGAVGGREPALRVPARPPRTSRERRLIA
ncbi:recombinase family protein [Streptomyces lydicus]|uniref:recombinase family protein n=1 Tax=Streptomyces lydicus TaxID=47763 RepID=UPI00378B21A6